MEKQARNISPELARLRGALGAAVKTGDPKVIARKRRELRVGVLAEDIRKALSTPPALEMSQRQDLAALLLGSDDPAGPEGLREYFLRVTVYETVHNEGDSCAYCDVDRPVAVNIHATSMDGGRLYAETCTGCVLPVLDRELDVDPCHGVTLEVCE